MVYVAGAILAIVLLLIWTRSSGKAHLRALADGSYARKHVYIEEDGTARELRPDEIEYLSTLFESGDGNRPYIKSRYRSLTPDQKIHGYLPRRRLPRGMSVVPTGSKEV